MIYIVRYVKTRATAGRSLASLGMTWGVTKAEGRSIKDRLSDIKSDEKSAESKNVPAEPENLEDNIRNNSIGLDVSLKEIHIK